MRFLAAIAAASASLAFAPGFALAQNSGARVQSAAEALAQDATEYVRHYGVSLPEALARLRAQEETVAATDRIQAAYADRLAGIWIEHEPAYRIVVLLTGAEPVPEQLVTAAGIDVPISFRTGAAATRSTVVAAITRHQAAIRAAFPDAQGIGADPRTGELVLLIKSSSDNLLSATVAAELTAITGVPARVRVLDRADENFTVEGGARVEGVDPANGRRYACTTGFVVTDTSRTGVVTAAHCPDTLTYLDPVEGALPLDFVGQWGARYQDVQVHLSGRAQRPLFYADAAKSLARTLTGWRNRSSTRAGDFVCHRGERTGYSCGDVEMIDFAPAGDLCGGACLPTWVRVSGPTCRGGDSGAPVFSGAVALGIVKGGSYRPDGSCAFYFYMSADYLPQGWSVLRAAPVRAGFGL